MTEQTDEGTQEQGKAMKRRGILAAAGAIVAGIVAKQATQPVAALDPNDLALGTTNTSSAQTTLTYTGPPLNPPGSALLVTAEATSVPTNGAMIAGVATRSHDPMANTGVYGEGPGYGVQGVGSGASTLVVGVRGTSTAGTGVQGSVGVGYGTLGVSTGPGVYGVSVGNHGVSGTTNAAEGSGYAGVYGSCGDTTGAGKYGVAGDSGDGNGIGVIGGSSTSIGVKGVAVTGFPIVGIVLGGPNGSTNAAINGQGLQGPGVQGQSNTGYGLVGYTNATDGHAALIGYAAAAGGIGVIGNSPGGAHSGGLAGVFNGDVTVNGALRVYDAPKNAAVKHPDGTYRLLYCEEAPESWFADYGRGTLAGDKADITLDPDFAALVHTDDYHVFLTAHAAQHLHVAQQSATGFTVVATPIGATQAGGPKPATGGGTFSWRVVAKRKDIAGERLAKVAAPPPLKPVTPFTVPETPEPKPPATKP